MTTLSCRTVTLKLDINKEISSNTARDKAAASVAAAAADIIDI